MFTKWLCIAVILLVEMEKGETVRFKRLPGGSNADRHEYPWAVQIYERKPLSNMRIFLCGGSLIDSTHVLTAAHCVVKSPIEQLEFHFGAHKITPHVKISEGEVPDDDKWETRRAIKIHEPGWPGGTVIDNELFNDIAIVQIDKIHHPTIDLWTGPMPNIPVSQGMAIGWGQIDRHGTFPEVLQELPVSIYNHTACAQRRPLKMLARDEICNGYDQVPNKGVCYYDSGSPVMYLADQWYQVGVVSRPSINKSSAGDGTISVKCAMQGELDYSSSIAYHYQWINNVLLEDSK